MKRLFVTLLALSVISCGDSIAQKNENKTTQNTPHIKMNEMTHDEKFVIQDKGT